MKKAIALVMITFLLSGVIQGQQKTTLSVKDLNSGIEKYVKKNYKDFKIVEAFQYNPFYEMKIQKGAESELLVFDKDGKFLSKKTEEGATVQTKTTMALKDVSSDITKYIKKNFEGFKLTEAYQFDLAYSVKVTKGAESESLLFDKDGNFEKKLTAAPPAAAPVQVKKADSVPAKEVKKEEPKPADTTKKK